MTRQRSAGDNLSGERDWRTPYIPTGRITLFCSSLLGPPELDSFSPGPSMLLAKELLERGETEVVLEYFELCGKYWTSGGRNLDQWTEEVKSNRTPQFGGYLTDERVPSDLFHLEIHR